MNFSQFQHITMQQLEVLVNLIDENSFSRAGSRMGLTQPSISKHIKNLEIFIDAPIIDRKQNGLSLTPEGRVLYDYARKILKLRDEAKFKIESSSDTGQNHIFIGASSIPATYILPTIIGKYMTNNPACVIHIHSGDSRDVIEMIHDGRVEIGFIGKPVIDKKLATEPVWNDSLLLVLGKDHPYADSDSLPVSELEKISFIGREEGSGTRSIIEKAFKSASPGIKLNVICEMGSSEAVKEAVVAGLGAAIISVHAVKREIASGIIKAIPIENLNIIRPFFMLYKKDFRPLTRHSGFMEFVRSIPSLG
jgi:DNA-binding transcriptional LysR family regulator